MASAARSGAKLSCVAIGTLREWALWATCRFWDPERLQTVLFKAHSGGNLTPAETTAPQGFCRARAMQQCRKRQHLRPLRPTVSWHLAAMRVHLGMPPRTTVARDSKTRLNTQCFTLASRRHLRMAPAGNPFEFHGGRCVGPSGPPAWVFTGFRATHRPPPFSMALLSVLYGALP